MPVVFHVTANRKQRLQVSACVVCQLTATQTAAVSECLWGVLPDWQSNSRQLVKACVVVDLTAKHACVVLIRCVMTCSIWSAVPR